MQRIEWANSLRGLAALIVLASHYYYTFWFNHSAAAYLARHQPVLNTPQDTPALFRLLDIFPVHLGSLGVALFFLLSGYVISISFDHYSRMGFLFARTMRVLPTYAAGYLVSCAVIWALADPRGELSVHAVLAGMVPGLSHLVNVAVPADGIVWTLIIELVFYVVCLLFYRRLASCWKTVALVAGLCVLVQTVLPPKASGAEYVILLSAPFLPVMLIGVVLASSRRGNFLPLQTALLVAGLTVTHAVLMVTSSLAPTPLSYRVTFIGTILLFAGISACGEGWRPRTVTSLLADISYPLYVVHPVLGYAMMSVLIAHGAGAVTAAVNATVAAVLTAYLLHRLIEAPTHRLGRLWARRLSGLSPSVGHSHPQPAKLD